MKEKILRFIQEELDEDGVFDIDFDSELLLDGIVDSLGVMRLVGYLEEQTGIPIPAEHITIDHFRTISEIDAYLCSRKDSGA